MSSPSSRLTIVSAATISIIVNPKVQNARQEKNLMNININNLTIAINALSKSLRIDGKSKVAQELEEKLLHLKHSSSDREFRIILKQISSCGAISQYADFSYEQDRLLTKIFDSCFSIFELMNLTD